MAGARNGATLLERFEGSAFGEVRTGVLVGVTAEGCPLVDFPGNPSGPLTARVLLGALREWRPRGEGQQEVLLGFDGGDERLPIILGRVCETVADAAVPAKATPVAEFEAHLDRRRVELHAEEEIVLRCGKSSVTLRRDGKVVVKGVEIVSRASRTNKIKGGSVNIN